MVNNFCSETIIKLYDNGKLIAVSDSEAAINDAKTKYAEKHSSPCDFSEITVQGRPVLDGGIGDIDIYENDDDHGYGYSEICLKDTELWDITMFQDRIDAETPLPFEEYIDNFCQESKAAWDEGPEIKDAINSHLYYWMQKNKDIPDGICAFKLTYDEIQCLLNTGFAAERVFVYTPAEG